MGWMCSVINSRAAGVVFSSAEVQEEGGGVAGTKGRDECSEVGVGVGRLIG